MARRKSRQPQNDQPDSQPDPPPGQASASHAVPVALSRELELKYAMPDAEFLASVGALTSIAGLTLEASTKSVNQDTYVDTPDFALLRRGLTLRLRIPVTHGGRDADQPADKGALVTLKSLPLDAGAAGLLDRLELEAPPQYDAESAPHPELADSGSDDPAATNAGAPAAILPGALSPASLPLAIHEYLSAHGGVPAVLSPYLELHQTRIKRIGRDAGVAYLETSLDDVTVFAAGSLTPTGQPALCGRFCEVEFETLIPGDRSTLQRLQAEPIVQKLAPLGASKLQRGLAMWAGNEPSLRVEDEQAVGGLGPTTTIDDALRGMLRGTLLDVLALEAGVRADQDMEAVHQMRVALRRARTGARFLGMVGMVDTQPATKPKALSRLLQAMKKLAVRLGHVRDLDVALANMGLSGENNAGRHAGSASAQATLTQRARAVRRLHKWLDGKHHAKFLGRLIKFCAGATGDPATNQQDTDARGFPVATQVRHVLPGLLLNQFQKLRVFEMLVDELGEMPAPTLHALRIECKRLRYMLEFSQPLLGAGIVRFLARLRKLQETLGQLNDAYVELARLEGDRELSDRRRKRELARAIKQARRQVPKRFAALMEPKVRREFILALAPL